MRALVTGSAGFIGSHLCENLMQLGWRVSGIDSFAPTYDTTTRRQAVSHLSSNAGFEFIEGDVNRLDLPTLVSESDVVFHLAARPGVRASWTDFANSVDSNILATQKVLQACASSPATRLVFASSSSVYGNAVDFPTTEEAPLAPISPYGVTKAACETLVQAYATQMGINAVSLRYFTVYGPRQRTDMAFSRWIQWAMRGEPLRIFGDGSATRDFTYVADVVEATVQAATCEIEGHEVFNVAGGSPTTLHDVIDVIVSAVGRPVELNVLPTVEGDPAKTGGDTKKFRARTGWSPKWALREGILSQVEWLRRNHRSVSPAAIVHESPHVQLTE